MPINLQSASRLNEKNDSTLANDTKGFKIARYLPMLFHSLPKTPLPTFSISDILNFELPRLGIQPVPHPLTALTTHTNLYLKNKTILFITQLWHIPLKLCTSVTYRVPIMPKF